MINCDAIMLWSDQHQWFYFSLVSVCITMALALAVRPLLREFVAEKKSHDWLWGIVIVVILTAGRWPSMFFRGELDADESQLLAGARALLYDPVFWRSVDGGTAGPLDFFALWPAGWIFGWNSYLAARITALVLLAISLILAHQCMSLVLGRHVARIAGLAAVCLEALSNTYSFLHCSTELLPMTLLTAAAYTAIQRWVLKGGILWSGLGGLLLGAVPLAKIQAVPLAGCMGVVWLFAELFSKETNANRRKIYLLAGAVLPAMLFALQLTIAGEWENFLIPYIFSNGLYSSQASLTLRQLLTNMLDRSTGSDSLLHLWLPGTVFWLLLMLRVRRPHDRVSRVFTLITFAALLLALFCVFFPRRPHLHYWQLIVVPISLFLGATINNRLGMSSPNSRKLDRWLVIFGACSLVGMLVVHRAFTPNILVKYHNYYQKLPQAELVNCINKHARPDDAVAIWGWSHYVYIETGLRQATRDANYSRSIENTPYLIFYRHRFLTDLLNSKPTFFLDTIGPCNMQAYNQPEFAHDQTFPALEAVIKYYYIKIEEVQGARLYRRRGSAPR